MITDDHPCDTCDQVRSFRQSCADHTSHTTNFICSPTILSSFTRKPSQLLKPNHESQSIQSHVGCRKSTISPPANHTSCFLPKTSSVLCKAECLQRILQPAEHLWFDPQTIKCLSFRATKTLITRATVKCCHTGRFSTTLRFGTLMLPFIRSSHYPNLRTNPLRTVQNR